MKRQDKDEKVVYILYMVRIYVLATITWTIDFGVSAGTKEQEFRNSWFVPIEGQKEVQFIIGNVPLLYKSQAVGNNSSMDHFCAT